MFTNECSFIDGTIAVITGGIAEAYYGISQHIQDKSWDYLPKEIQEVVTKFKQKYGR